MNSIYIKGISCISCQSSFVKDFHNDPITLIELQTEFTNAVEPDYKSLTEVPNSRRFSKYVKMGLFCALETFQNSAISKVDGLIFGSGLGGLNSSESFLTSFLQAKGKSFSPTPFMQSLPSSVTGQIAITLGCEGYTNTYTQRGFSFETALLDSFLFLEEYKNETLIIGGIDELTVNLCDLIKIEQDPALKRNYGEGCVVAAVQSDSNNALCQIKGMKLIFSPGSHFDINEGLSELLTECHLNLNDIDLVLAGNCGNEYLDVTIEQVLQQVNDKPKVYFKKYSGDYPAATSFALWLAVMHLNNKHLKRKEINNVLIVNHWNNQYFSLLLICGM